MHLSIYNGSLVGQAHLGLDIHLVTPRVGMTYFLFSHKCGFATGRIAGILPYFRFTLNIFTSVMSSMA